MQCQHAREYLSDYVGGQLDRALVVTLENHLNQCVACRDEVAGLRSVWSLLDATPVVDTPLFFHENLMHRLNAELDNHAPSRATRFSLWNWRAALQPRALAAAAAILIVVLGGIGYVKTQPAALGPFGMVLGLAPHTPTPPLTRPGVRPSDGQGQESTVQNAATSTMLQAPTLEWVVDAQGQQQLKVQFQLANVDAATLAGLEYTISGGESAQSATDVLTQKVPTGGKVEVLVPWAQTIGKTATTVVITLHSQQDGSTPIRRWSGSLPPQP